MQSISLTQSRAIRENPLPYTTKRRSIVQDVDTVSSERVLKALANTERLRILGYLRHAGESAVGDVCSALNLAPGSVSYHLRRMETVGLVERVKRPGGDRRQSWWRARHTTTSPVFGDETSPETATGVRRAINQSYADAYVRYLGRIADLPKQWTDHEISQDIVLSLTLDEMKELEEELLGLFDRWSSKTEKRDDGENSENQQVVLTARGFVWLP